MFRVIPARAASAVRAVEPGAESGHGPGSGVGVRGMEPECRGRGPDPALSTASARQRVRTDAEMPLPRVLGAHNPRKGHLGACQRRAPPAPEREPEAEEAAEQTVPQPTLRRGSGSLGV
ncbi:hypothetical protein GCM10009768_16170 [Leucobacter iarius]|uniref:Uncharacterized protein n=1 Tax=Leucobacter iarius TaxID=333963 RepID=A0ABP4XQP7_9MICO